MADNQLNIKLNAIDNTSKAFNSVKGSILSLRNALIGLGAGAILKPIIDITKEFETLRTTLRFVTGSVEGGQRAFGLLRNLSKQTQFSTKELSETDGFVKFISQSRDWAFQYIEEVQTALSEFDKSVDPLLKWAMRFGILNGETAHTKILSEISEAYDKLKSVLPENTETPNN